jgi:hypothetical protein
MTQPKSFIITMLFVGTLHKQQQSHRRWPNANREFAHSISVISKTCAKGLDKPSHVTDDLGH